MFNNFLMLIIGLSESHCQNDQEGHFEHKFIADGGKMCVNKELCLFCKDQGCMKDEDDVPEDDAHELDLDYDACDFDFECSNSDDSNYEE